MESEQSQGISKDMTIGEFVEQYPDLVEILLAEGVHCVGCGASYFETIEEGLMGHGKSDEEIADVVKRLNDELKALQGASEKPEHKHEHSEVKEVTITEKAGSKLGEILKANNKEGMGLRIRVMPGGCAGYKYSLELDKEASEKDEVFTVSGNKFFVDPQSREMLSGATVDYVEGLQESGFKINNPNAKSSCGCGKSFG